jgi:post-segregation antitoxin (ccd killing protein)
LVAGLADVAKLSISLPDDLVRDLRTVAHGNVSAFVTAAVRNELFAASAAPGKTRKAASS